MINYSYLPNFPAGDSSRDELLTRDSRNILSSQTSSSILRAVLATVRLESISCLTSNSTPYTAMLGTPSLASTPTHFVL